MTMMAPLDEQTMKVTLWKLATIDRILDCLVYQYRNKNDTLFQMLKEMNEEGKWDWL